MTRRLPWLARDALLLLALGGITAPAAAQEFRPANDEEESAPQAVSSADRPTVEEPTRADPAVAELEAWLEQLRTAEPRQRRTSRALAATQREGQSVTERPHPELQPLGVRTGGFTLYPELSATTLFDSNVFRQRDGVADVAAMVAGRLRARSNWQRHALGLDLRTSYRGYAEQTTENAWQYRVTGTGRLDIDRTSSLSATLLQAHEIIQRGAAGEDLITREPVRVDRSQAELTGRTRQGPFDLRVTGSVLRSNFEDAETPAGLPAPQDFRDNTIVGGLALLGYYIAPETSAYVSIGHDIRNFDVDDGPVRRDADSTEALIGVRGLLGPLIRGRAALGVIHEAYVDPSVPDLTALSFDGRLEWLVTPLTTITGFARRQTGNTAIVSSPAYLSTRFGVRADHELLRNLILNASAGYDNQNFRLSPREDQILTGALGADWIPDRRFLVQLRGAYRNRDSKGVLNPRIYEEIEVSLGLTSRM